MVERGGTMTRGPGHSVPRPGRARPDRVSTILLCAAAGSFGIMTIVDSYIGSGAGYGETDWTLPVARFAVHPLLLVAWLALRPRRAPRPVRRLDRACVPALLLSAWFVVSAAFAEDPIASLGRAVPLLFMISGAFFVVGPSVASAGGTVVLFRAVFVASLLLSSAAVACVVVGEHETWGLWGDRFYGPLNATTLGPICVMGCLAGLALWRLAPKRSSRAVIVLAALWLFALLVMTRARGSYLFLLVAAGVYFAIGSRRTMVLRCCVLAVVAVVALVVALNWWSFDVSHSDAAAYLRLDQRDMLAQRSEVWGANASFWEESPVFGIGLGNEVTVSEVAKRSHSAYLSTLNEGGVPALGLLLLSLVTILVRALRTALHHPVAEMRLLGVLAVATVVGTAALGGVETTLINAASTGNTFVWITAAAAVAASRGIPRGAPRASAPLPGVPARCARLAAGAA